MRPTTYQHCYRVLGVTGDCDWKEVRLAYRRRVRQCHPDRLPPGLPPGKPAANRDDEFRQVVLAYRLLAAFRKRHGELPPPFLGISDNTSTISVPTRASRSRPEPEPAARKTHVFPWLPPFHRALVALFICGVTVSALLEQPGHGREARDAPAGTIAVGMDPQSVVDIQGAPSHTRGSVWFYGDSGVIFDRGCVVGWENQPPFPLRTLVGMTYFPGRDAGEDCSRPNN